MHFQYGSMSSNVVVDVGVDVVVVRSSRDRAKYASGGWAIYGIELAQRDTGLKRGTTSAET